MLILKMLLVKYSNIQNIVLQRRLRLCDDLENYLFEVPSSTEEFGTFKIKVVIKKGKIIVAQK